MIIGSGDKHLVELTVDSGTVTATDGHPFWVASERRWIEAEDLEPGHRIETTDRRSATVTGTREYHRQQRVYNLTVDTIHTFYVIAGTSDLLVHNDWCGVHDGGLPEGTGPGKWSCTHSGPNCPPATTRAGMAGKTDPEDTFGKTPDPNDWRTGTRQRTGPGWEPEPGTPAYPAPMPGATRKQKFLFVVARIVDRFTNPFG